MSQNRKPQITTIVKREVSTLNEDCSSHIDTAFTYGRGSGLNRNNYCAFP